VQSTPWAGEKIKLLGLTSFMTYIVHKVNKWQLPKALAMAISITQFHTAY